MLGSVLIANRGEIAVRVITTLRRLGVHSIAVYSDADAGAPHVLLADEAMRLGPAPAAESYLSIDRVLEAARATGAEAIHPGYGFLSENPAFARACESAGIVFVGPPAEAMEALGDKVRAKAAAEEAGVPVLPGLQRPGLTDEEIMEFAGSDGQFPLMVKAAAGGGGRGMRIVEAPNALPEALKAARREALAGFGDDALLVERYVERARHVEVQLLVDAHGAALHLGERECSLQRRHQKIIEESPSPVVGTALRERLGDAAVRIARAAGYVGAGTAEFIMPADDPEQFAFLEVNARLQVEHPVTELVCGLDLVELQLRIAAGEPLALAQEDVSLTGHAIEARVCAEDPANGFLPATGTIVALREPAGEGVRVDSGVAAWQHRHAVLRLAALEGRRPWARPRGGARAAAACAGRPADPGGYDERRLPRPARRGAAGAVGRPGHRPHRTRHGRRAPRGRGGRPSRRRRRRHRGASAVRPRRRGGPVGRARRLAGVRPRAAALGARAVGVSRGRRGHGRGAARRRARARRRAFLEHERRGHRARPATHRARRARPDLGPRRGGRGADGRGGSRGVLVPRARAGRRGRRRRGRGVARGADAGHGAGGQGGRRRRGSRRRRARSRGVDEDGDVADRARPTRRSARSTSRSARASTRGRYSSSWRPPPDERRPAQPRPPRE